MTKKAEKALETVRSITLMTLFLSICGVETPTGNISVFALVMALLCLFIILLVSGCLQDEE